MSKKSHAEYMRKWRNGNEDYAEYMRQYRQENRDKIASDHQAWRQRNQKRNAELAREWIVKNPVLAACIRKAQAANSRFPGRLTAQDVFEIIERSGYKCHWCGKENLRGPDLTLEHLQPVNDKRYLTVACRSCNGAHKHKYSDRIPITPEERKAKDAVRLRGWYLNNQDLQRQRQRDYEARIRLREQGFPVDDAPRTKAIKWNQAHSDIKPAGTSMAQFLHSHVKSSMARYSGDITINAPSAAPPMVMNSAMCTNAPTLPPASVNPPSTAPNTTTTPMITIMSPSLLPDCAATP